MAQTRPSAPASDYSCPSSSLVRCGLEPPEEYGVLQGSRACPLEAPAPGLQICICWICSLDGALPLGQEALISCVGGVGTRSGGAHRAIPDVVWKHRTAELLLEAVSLIQGQQEGEVWLGGPD